jgi:hypothetical protein
LSLWYVMMKISLILLTIFLNGCSTADERNQARRMKENGSSERIYRLSNQKVYVESAMEIAVKEPYPWESGTAFSKITVDRFRCQGSHDRKEKERDGKIYKDCCGLADHGLPYGDNDEYVYPVMVSLLNKVQKAFNKKVVITAGHRCPAHQAYVTLGKSKISRYMIGAKVDFYLEGMEQDALTVVEKLKSFYEDDKGFSEFYEVRNKDGTRAWHNKEVIFTINTEGEHTVLLGKKHAVVSIDVRYDRSKSEGIVLDWKRAYEGYIRH